jgi:hypothetical protein
VRNELEREPKTLFVVGSYQVGKEKAIAAVAAASGGRALVPARRALSLRLCHAWDAAIHTEVAGPDVTVHVAAMGSAGAAAHEEMRALLAAQEGAFKAVVTFRPTGWTYTKALAGGAAPRPWAENEGATRVYGVPYSEHSSYTELHALVAALRPGRVVPTVNAESASERERLALQFSKSTDPGHDRRTLSFHFRRGAGPSGEAEVAAAGAAARAAEASDAVDLSSVSLSHQAALWEQLARDRPYEPGQAAERDVAPALASPAAAQGAAGGESRGESAAGETNELAVLREVVGAAAPLSYLRSLLGDGGDVEAAAAIHFGANGGEVPPSWRDSAADARGERGAEVGFSEAGSSASHAAAGAAAARGDELALPLGTVAWVLGKEFKQ